MNERRSPLLKAYADTPDGQVHYRVTGNGPALVLLHWTPWSGRMFEPLMRSLANAGYAAYAFDLLGYGRSDPRPTQWSMNAYARNIALAMKAAGLTEAEAVLGGHMSASVALELALEEPRRIRRLVLDGLPFLTPELRTVLKTMADQPRPGVTDQEDIGQLPFQRAVGLLSEYIPGFAVDDGTLDLVWTTMLDYLETDFVNSGSVAAGYEPADRLPYVTQPVLVLGAESDSMAGSFQKTVDLLPRSANHMFTGVHPLYQSESPTAYAIAILDFMRGGSGTPEES